MGARSTAVLPLLLIAESRLQFAFALQSGRRASLQHHGSAFCFSTRLLGSTSSFPTIRTNARAGSRLTSSSAQGHGADTEPRDKVGRPAGWWQLPPIDGAPLLHHTDRYGSAVIEDPALNSSITDPAEFSAKLATSMAVWRQAGIKAVWLRLATEACSLLPRAIDQGFLPHHASPDHITLTSWLVEERQSRLPPGPSHFVGVAGLVLDVQQGGRGRVLVVQEKSGPAAGINMWKLPGGLVDNKEDIATAAVREVFEETGVAAKFQRLMTIHENHHVRGPGREGSTDLFIICFLTPILTRDGEVPEPVAQEEEIAACKWMPVEELMSQPLYQDGMFNVAMTSALAAATNGLGGLKCDSYPLAFRPGMAALMYPDL